MLVTGRETNFSTWPPYRPIRLSVSSVYPSGRHLPQRLVDKNTYRPSKTSDALGKRCSQDPGDSFHGCVTQIYIAQSRSIALLYCRSFKCLSRIDLCCLSFALAPLLSLIMFTLDCVAQKSLIVGHASCESRTFPRHHSKTVVTCKLKHLQNICKNVLHVK